MNHNDVLPVAETPDHDPVAQELQRLLDQPVEPRRPSPPLEKIDGVRVGTLIGFVHGDQPLVTYDANVGLAALVARTVENLQPEHIGEQVVLVFENGDPGAPIITGRLRSPSRLLGGTRLPQIEADADGHRLTLTVRDQLVLRCGKASITLTAAGKILIHGEYVSARSNGAMRIKGGSVQIN
jgi:hypothetical protein